MIENPFPAFLLTIFVNFSLATEFSGVINKDTTWTAQGNPYLITGDVIVSDSAVFKISEGVEVRITGDFMFLVRGKLEAKGISARPIKFMPDKPDKKKDLWRGIQFIGKNSGGYLSYCEISNAYKNMIRNCSPVFDNCCFQSNTYAIYCSYSMGSKIYKNRMESNVYGIFCDYSSPIIQKNTITNNEYGIYCILSASPIVGENVVTGNTEKDIHMDETMGGNKTQNINDHVFDLMKDIF
jgi:parallel beta-helix repeat protein